MEVTFAGAVSLQDFRRAQSLDGRHRWFSLTVLGLIALMLLSQLYFLLSDGFSLTTVTTSLPLLVLLVFFWVFLRYQIDNAWKKSQALFAAISGKITADRVQYNTAKSESQIGWDLFQKYKIAPDMVLLYQTSSAFNVFPRHFFKTEADWAAFTQLVQQQLAKK